MMRAVRGLIRFYGLDLSVQISSGSSVQPPPQFMVYLPTMIPYNNAIFKCHLDLECC